MSQTLIVLSGPTAVGKTELSILLAEKINGEIISADSMQVYEYMNIGSAKIMPQEMHGVTHHLIDILKPWETFDVTVFQRHALASMKTIDQNGHIPILAGGTGFYIQSILYDIDFTSEGESTGYRMHLEQLLQLHSPEYLHAMLQQVDEKAAQLIHPNNSKRIIRALEFYRQTGQKISEHNEKERKKSSPYHYVYFVLNDKREVIYRSINERVDKMIKSGLVDEVVRLKNMGCTKEMVSMQGIGYKEILAYLDGEYSLEEAIRIIKRDSRHFAKRQLTWFRREKDVVWVNRQDYQSTDEMLAFMLHTIREKGICI